MLLKDLDTILHYYAISYSIHTGKDGINRPILFPGDHAYMAKILAQLTLLLIRADVCTPHIINSVWAENNDACLAHGGPAPPFLIQLQLIQSTSGQQILNYLSWIPNCKVSTAFPTPSKPYFSTPTRKSPMLVSQSRQEQPWQNS